MMMMMTKKHTAHYYTNKCDVI